MIHRTDILIIGSGIAGLTFALKMASSGPDGNPPRITIATKKEGSDTSTNLAQGGIAAVFSPDDTFDSHVEDTLKAGAGLCDEEAVRVLVQEGPQIVRDLIDWGVQFTRNEGGQYDLGREGGHSQRRILHAKDLTGREIERALLEQLRQHDNVTIHEQTMAVDLWTVKENRRRRCVGALVVDSDNGNVRGYLARAVLLSSGGLGQLYQHTTNPPIATGDGVAMAWRAGARIENMEFVQFHPTALYAPGKWTFLISEAVRGEGAILKTMNGETFMENYHEMGCLAPRDIVARAIDREMKRAGDPHVLLDLTHLDGDFIRDRFPNIAAQCEEYGYNITEEPLPVVPAAHYSCGGVVTDLHGETNIRGLFATGEVACTGVHGANRLASNSLLEAVVFSERAYKRISQNWKRYTAPEDDAAPELPPLDRQMPEFEPTIVAHTREELRRLMQDYVGIVRTNDRLKKARRHLDVLIKDLVPFIEQTPTWPPLVEVWNMLQTCKLIVRSAQRRKESRGLHYNLDYPQTRPDVAPRNTVLQRR